MWFRQLERPPLLAKHCHLSSRCCWSWRRSCYCRRSILRHPRIARSFDQLQLRAPTLRRMLPARGSEYVFFSRRFLLCVPFLANGSASTRFLHFTRKPVLTRNSLTILVHKRPLGIKAFSREGLSH